MNKTYSLLLTTLLYTGISSVYAVPEVFTNANDFIKEHSKVITFEAIDGQTSPAEIASYRLDATLWGWAKGTGLIQINPENAQSIVQVESTIAIEDISWNTDGSILYGVAGTALYAYDFNTHELAKKCDNFPSEVEAIDTLQDGTLVFALHENDDSSLHSFNTESCTINATAPIATNYSDIEGIASNCN